MKDEAITRKLSLNEIQKFQKKIFQFATANYRDFPWRNTVDPYEILVSEVMLQQTQTERVVPKYVEWLAAFPTVQSLAKASLTEVLTHWSGLGYNRRARFLQQAAQIVVQKYAGKFPTDAILIDELPGVGEYTAKAVACFAFGAKEVFIETNIRTVFINEFFQNDGSVIDSVDITNKKGIDDKTIIPLIEQTVYEKDVRLWYYALMDYGAHIKKEVVNPNRRSKSYTKQSKFSGSLRQARGAIIRQLTKIKTATIEEIAAQEEVDVQKLQQAAALLVKEKMIVKKNGKYEINV
jgi:A/G-specific adenine glycosylase